MNKLIQKLTERSIEEKLTLDEFIAALKAEPHDFYGFRRHELEKFAELIVREHIARVQLQNRMDETTEQWVYDNLVDDFKEHFGVK